jgi:hypothetical protein
MLTLRKPFFAHAINMVANAKDASSRASCLRKPAQSTSLLKDVALCWLLIFRGES